MIKVYEKEHYPEVKNFADSNLVDILTSDDKPALVFESIYNDDTDSVSRLFAANYANIRTVESPFKRAMVFKGEIYEIVKEDHLLILRCPTQRLFYDAVHFKPKSFVIDEDMDEIFRDFSHEGYRRIS